MYFSKLLKEKTNKRRKQYFFGAHEAYCELFEKEKLTLIRLHHSIDARE
jgi:hypothetical protein